jgi:hypothetical protein
VDTGEVIGGNAACEIVGLTAHRNRSITDIARSTSALGNTPCSRYDSIMAPARSGPPAYMTADARSYINGPIMPVLSPRPVRVAGV